MGGLVSHELAVAELAEGQSGLFTAAQATAVGVPRQALSRMLNRQLVERLAHGVYRLTGAPPAPADELRAAWLGATESRDLVGRRGDLVVSHRSATLLHRLGDLDADVHEFTSSQRRQSRRRDVRFHRADLPAIDVTVVDGLPVTTVERTVQDLAHVHTDGEHLARVVRDAIFSAHVLPTELAGRLRPFAHRYGHRIGDGDGLLASMLNRVGVPEALLEAARRGVAS